MSDRAKAGALISSNHPTRLQAAIAAAFASIRAEGSAERAKLEGELRYARTWIAASVRHHQRDSMLARIDRALAQPAESGATEQRDEYLDGIMAKLSPGAKP